MPAVSTVAVFIVVCALERLVREIGLSVLDRDVEFRVRSVGCAVKGKSGGVDLGVVG